jgi:hypothetical protein
MEEVVTTFGWQGGQNVAKVIENRRTNDPNGEWPDTALGIVSVTDGTNFAFVAWSRPSPRGTPGWGLWAWETSCDIASNLVNEISITDNEEFMKDCRWYQSCRTDLDPPYEPIDKDYVHDPEEEVMDLVGTVYYYEHDFERDADGWGCKLKTP